MSEPDSRLRELFGSRDDPEARRELVELFDGLAQRLARRFNGRGVALDDLVQVARFGLLKAIDRYDPDREVLFTTYAGRTIVGEIKHYFRDQAWSVRVPRSLQNQWLEVSRVVETLTHSLGRSPTIAEIAEQLDIDEETVLEALDAGAAYTAGSLDRTPDDTGEVPLIDRLGEDDPDLEMAADRREIAMHLEVLPERERKVLFLRFFEGKTQAEIAEDIGVSQVHVSRILTRTLEHLRGALEDDSGPSDQ